MLKTGEAIAVCVYALAGTDSAAYLPHPRRSAPEPPFAGHQSSAASAALGSGRAGRVRSDDKVRTGGSVIPGVI